MPTHHPSRPSTSHEERAFFTRLAALNLAFESARAGQKAQSFCHGAQASEVLLAAFLDQIKTQRQK
ncbi:MAG: hypothetical protein ACYCZQ_05455 [Burkholderiales bacterium]